MSKEKVQEIYDELMNIESQRIRCLLDEEDYVRKKLKFFTKYAEYEKELVEAINRSPYCFITYVERLLNKEDNRYVKERMRLHCSDVSCHVCCKRDIYDYLLRNINRLDLV